MGIKRADTIIYYFTERTGETFRQEESSTRENILIRSFHIFACETVMVLLAACTHEWCIESSVYIIIPEQRKKTWVKVVAVQTNNEEKHKVLWDECLITYYRTSFDSDDKIERMQFSIVSNGCIPCELYNPSGSQTGYCIPISLFFCLCMFRFIVRAFKVHRKEYMIDITTLQGNNRLWESYIIT